MSIANSRQAELIDAGILTTPVDLVGAGAVGSFTALGLAKIGFSDVCLYDMDIVEEANLGTQLHKVSDMNKYKVEALRASLEEQSGVAKAWSTVREAVVPELDELFASGGVVLSCVDNMATRKDIFRHARNSSSAWLIDARMGGYQAEVYVCRIGDNKSMREYQKTLWTDEEASPLPCTKRAVAHHSFFIAGIIIAQLRAVLEGYEYSPVVIMDMQNLSIIKMDERRG